MINTTDTILLVDKFFRECFDFWIREGKECNEAIILALNEASDIKHDPFTPNGDILDTEAQKKYIKYARERGVPS